MQSSIQLVGLVGATGSGKTTLARSLVQDFGFTNLHMGRPLKDMLIALGLTERDVAGTPEERARPQSLLGGKSARDAMKSLGTDWARNMVTPDLWANAVRLKLADHFSTANPSPVVIDDLRFPNDWAVVKEMGGTILTVRRSGEPRRTMLDRVAHRIGVARWWTSAVFGWKPLHETEYHWRDAPADGEVWNDGTTSDLLANTMMQLSQSGTAC